MLAAAVAAAAVEKRIDPADSGAYTLEEFVEEYGGSLEDPPAEWLGAPDAEQDDESDGGGAGGGDGAVDGAPAAFVLGELPE